MATLTKPLILATAGLFVTAAIVAFQAKPRVFENNHVKQAVSTPLTGEQLCARDLTSHVTFKDPDSVKINSIQAESNFYKMSVSAKNGFGGYNAPIECSCQANPKLDKVTYLFCASS